VSAGLGALDEQPRQILSGLEKVVVRESDLGTALAEGLETTMTELTRFECDWGSPPGDTIQDALEEQGMTQVEFAERTGFSKKHVNGLIKGSVAITAETALKLEAVLGPAAAFWLRREMEYREDQARKRMLDDASKHTGWLKEFPLAAMARFGWIRRYPRDRARPALGTGEPCVGRAAARVGDTP
jgi:addiction module HigA family antidote